MNAIQPIEPPAPTAKDKIIGAIKALVGEVPGGSLAAEICGWFLRTPFERRTEEWQRSVAETLCRLANEHGADLEELQKDDRFIDTVLHATQVALRNAQTEKREALRNAILNSGVHTAPDDSRRQMFLNHIDVFTPWHLRLVHLFAGPVEWFKSNKKTWPNLRMGASSSVLEAAYPELKLERDLYDQVWRDLHARGLVTTDSLHSTVSGQGLGESLATPEGEQFLAFISEPPVQPGPKS